MGVESGNGDCCSWQAASKPQASCSSAFARGRAGDLDWPAPKEKDPEAEDGDRVSLPSLNLRDAPAYPYRSIMIDVARNPHSIAVLEDVIRLAHHYKLRFLHLHLSDDQLFTFPFKGITDVLENNVSYTRAELEGLVAYAALRGITIIPGIDLPGHSSRL